MPLCFPCIADSLHENASQLLAFSIIMQACERFSHALKKENAHRSKKVVVACIPHVMLLTGSCVHVKRSFLEKACIHTWPALGEKDEVFT